ncbi:MAG: hypothetical protein RMK43_05735 [Cyclobacteriaceae bacterium]|nr:hypothetical protein [Cyclobacteriaceae bacterium]
MMLRPVALQICCFLWFSTLFSVYAQPLSYSGRLVQGDDGLFEYTPAKGDELRYIVTYPDGSQYDFVITLMHYNYPGKADFPIAFRWDIGEPLNSSGLIELGADCLEKSELYLNYFKDGTYLKLSDVSTVFVSAKNFNEVWHTPNRSTRMIMDGEEVMFYAKSEYSGFLIRLGDKTLQLRTLKLSNANTNTDNKELAFLPGHHRLIVFMKLNFSIELKEIKLSDF